MTECYDFTYLRLIMFEVYFLIVVMKSAKHLKQQINTEIHMLAANLASSMSNLICSLLSPTPCFGGNFICYQNTYFKEIAESSHSIPKSVNVNLQKRFSHITTVPFTYKQFIICNPIFKIIKIIFAAVCSNRDLVLVWLLQLFKKISKSLLIQKSPLCIFFFFVLQVDSENSSQFLQNVPHSSQP